MLYTLKAYASISKKNIDGSSLKLIGRTWYISRGQLQESITYQYFSEIHENHDIIKME